MLKYKFGKPKKNIEILRDPPIVPAMHEINPRTCLGNKWWQKVRKKVLAESGEYCQCCGELFTDVPDCHERYNYKYRRKSVHVTLQEVVVICKLCHRFIHRGFFNRQVKQGKFLEAYRIKVLRHGLALLNGEYVKQHPTRVLLFKPEQWYLEIEGKKFYGTSIKSYHK